jgi:hypothetical protein
MNRYSISRNTRPEGSFKKRADALSPTADHVVAQALPLEIDVHSNKSHCRAPVQNVPPLCPRFLHGRERRRAAR